MASPHTPTGRQRTHSHDKILHESIQEKRRSSHDKSPLLQLPRRVGKIGKLTNDRMDGLDQKLSKRQDRRHLVNRFILREEHDTNLIFNKSKRSNLDLFLQKRPSRNTLMSLNVIQENEMKKEETKKVKSALGNFLMNRPTRDQMINRNIYKEREDSNKKQMKVAQLKLQELLSKRPAPEALADDRILVTVAKLIPSEKLVLVEGNEMKFVENTNINNVAAISSGWAHNVLIDNEGKLHAFGLGDNGRLGNGDQLTIYSALPTKVAFDQKVDQISCGDNHSAIISNGKCYTFGVGNWGRLGLGDQEDRNTPTLVELEDKCVKVASGGYHTLILSESGKIYATGWNKDGRLGIGDSTKFMVSNAIEITGFDDKKVVDIECGQDFSVALTEDGSVYTWGTGIWGALGHDSLDSLNKPKRVEFFNDKQIKYIACGGFHVIAVSSDGKIYSWGYNNDGQLGREEPDRAMYAIPALVESNSFEEAKSFESISALFCGKTSSFLALNGKLFGWGCGKNGILGNGSEDVQPRPVEIALDAHVIGGSAGQSHSIVLGNNGKIFCAGERAHGRLGLE